MQDLQIAYDIGLYLQSLTTTDSTDKSKVYTYAPSEGFFPSGPKCYYNQTSKGFLFIDNDFSHLYTPLGEWIVVSIIGYYIPAYKNYKRTVLNSDRLKLKLTDQGYEVVSWDGQDLPAPTMKKYSDYIVDEQAKQLWHDFIQLRLAAGDSLLANYQQRIFNR